MSGEFCTACGTRATPSEAPPAATAPRKINPLVWVLVAIAGLFVLFGIAVVGGGLYVAHKARQIGLDTALMQNNPGLATAKLLAATNPDLEVVSTDEGRGIITIRQKSTGKIMTVSFDDLKRGKITFNLEGKESGTESLSMGANQAAVPAWIPAYPNSKPAGTFSFHGKEGTSASFRFQTQDAPADVTAFYERGLKQNGFSISLTSRSSTGDSLLSGNDAANRRTVMVTVGTGGHNTTVSVTYSQK
ncbi:MAG: hypothetical protein ABSF54_20845 [Bryobacteraceae bacterium]